MAVTINASTSAGLISTADTSGILQLQTANTAALTIDGSQNVGIGTASPASILHLKSADPIQYFEDSSGTSSFCSIQNANGVLDLQADNNATVASSAIKFSVDGSERMRLDSSGNLGLGVTPQTWNSGYKVLQFSSSGALFGATGNTYLGSNVYANSADSNTYITTNFASMYRQVDGKHLWYTAASGTAGNSITFTNGMSLLADGSLLVGTTSGTGARFDVLAGATDEVTSFRRGAGRTKGLSRFLNESGTTVGYIEWLNSATSYNTSSDYRLKNTITPMTGALAKVALLKPVTYKWNVDGSDGQGFIAHELAEVVPDCVSGEKDAVDADGNPQYQGIDTSFLVATLTAAIQEQQALIQSLKARLDAANL